MTQRGAKRLRGHGAVESDRPDATSTDWRRRVPDLQTWWERLDWAIKDLSLPGDGWCPVPKSTINLWRRGQSPGAQIDSILKACAAIYRRGGPPAFWILTGHKDEDKDETVDASIPPALEKTLAAEPGPTADVTRLVVAFHARHAVELQSLTEDDWERIVRAFANAEAVAIDAVRLAVVSHEMSRIREAFTQPSDIHELLSKPER